MAKSLPLSLRFPAPLLKALDKLAADRGSTRSDTIIAVLRREMERMGFDTYDLPESRVATKPAHAPNLEDVTSDT